MPYDPPSFGRRIAVWAVLLLCLPIALMAILHPPNEYKATLGLAALDCDGPLQTYMFAVPTLLVYGVALVLNGWRWRRPANSILAIACFAICTGTIMNVARAVVEEREQAAECAAR